MHCCLLIKVRVSLFLDSFCIIPLSLSVVNSFFRSCFPQRQNRVYHRQFQLSTPNFKIFSRNFTIFLFTKKSPFFGLFSFFHTTLRKQSFENLRQIVLIVYSILAYFQLLTGFTQFRLCSSRLKLPISRGILFRTAHF